MAVIELNDSATYDVQLPRLEMGRASVVTFTKPADVSDATALADRSEVIYTLNGVCVFYGRTLPASRSQRPGDDSLVYTAADPLEWMGNNPVANGGNGVNEWYNRKDIDIAAYPYPVGRTIAQILQTEFASIVGAGKIIAALDFAEAAGPAGVIPLNIQIKGKSWLGLLEMLIGESPGLSFWYDPSTYNGAGTYGTLRFYDLAVDGSSPIDIVSAYRDPASTRTYVPNLESQTLTEDVSQSFDSLYLHGWGDMVERYDVAAAEFTAPAGAAIGSGAPYLRRNSAGVVQVFDPTAGAHGTWVNEDTVSPRPYFPESRAPGYNLVGRRFSVAKEIVDLRITPKSSGSPSEYVRDVQSMWLQSLQWVWGVGASWANGANLYQVRLEADIKLAPFGPIATVDNDGTVVPNAELYPLYPTIRATDPRFPLPVPTGYERNFFVVKDPLVRRTNYVFSSNVSGDAHYDNLVGEACFKYWNTSPGIELRYTGADPFIVSFTATLGYDKRLDLYDERFLKYTNKDGVVLRDDTTLLTTYGTQVWNLVKRKRIFGSAQVHYPAASPAPLTAFRMGAAVNWRNYAADNGTRALGVRIQSIDLSSYLQAQRVTIGFDRVNAFLPLQKFLQGKEWFEGSAVHGDAKLEGKRGDRLNPGKKSGPKKPIESGGSQGETGNQKIKTSDPADITGTWRGVITQRNQAAGTATKNLSDPKVVKYVCATIDGLYTAAQDRVPLMRTLDEGDELVAADVGSECIVSVVPKDGAPGQFDVILLVAQERLRTPFILGTILAGSTTTPGKAPTVNYKWVSFDGAFSANVDQPIYRPYNSNVRLIPAPVGARCKILLDPNGDGTVTARLWSCPEAIDFEQCGPTFTGYVYSPGLTEFDLDAIAIDVNGEVAVDVNYNLALDNSAPYPAGSPENEIGISSDYQIAFDNQVNAAVKDQTLSRLLNPQYPDTLPATVTYTLGVTANLLNQPTAGTLSPKH